MNNIDLHWLADIFLYNNDTRKTVVVASVFAHITNVLLLSLKAFAHNTKKIQGFTIGYKVKQEKCWVNKKGLQLF